MKTLLLGLVLTIAATAAAPAHAIWRGYWPDPYSYGVPAYEYDNPYYQAYQAQFVMPNYAYGAYSLSRYGTAYAPAAWPIDALSGGWAGRCIQINGFLICH